jgi:protein-tyrosine phosphatase
MDLQAIVTSGASVLISLMDDHEYEELKVAKLATKASVLGLTHYRLAIADASAPDEGFETQWGSAGRDIRESLGNGEAVVIHCKGGLGRTGMIAARLLVELGAQPDEAIAKVRAARPGAIETRAQEQHVRRCQAVTDYPVKEALAALPKMYFKKEALEQSGLPNIGYPVPIDFFKQITEQPRLSTEDLLYWLQAYSELDPNDWRKLDYVIGMLADSLNGDEADSDWQVKGRDWSLRFGYVDLSKEIVTLQRQGTLIAAIQPCEDGTLAVSAYHGLDARAARMLTGLGQKPADDGKAAMRDNNWASCFPG